MVCTMYVGYPVHVDNLQCGANPARAPYHNSTSNRFGNTKCDEYVEAAM